jgi:hypothetical protein
MPRILRILALVAVAFALPAAGQKPQVIEAGGAAEITTLTARIEAIDYASRVVAIKGSLGRTVALNVDDRVRNLGKVKAGDEIVPRYAEALTIALTKAGAGGSETVTTAAPVAAPAGARPGVASAQQTKIVARIEQVDTKRQVALLEGPNGRYVEVKVKDPGLFSEMNFGGSVNITYAEAVVVEVATPGK